VLVVGGAGFVGGNLVRALLAKGPREVVVIDNLLSADRANVATAANAAFIEGSITSDRVLARVQDDFEYMFQLATYHGNQSSIANPLADHENNTLTTLKFCERIKGFKNVRKVVYSSAGCTVAPKTYAKAHATTEDAPVSLWMDSPYQISKVVGELYFNYYFRRHGVPVVKARFQNVYGPGEILGAGKWRGTPATVWRNVTPTFIYRALQGAALPVENGGVATRDFIHVDDIVCGLMACALSGEPGEVYNLASGVETSILDLARAINHLTGNPTPIDGAPPRDWDRSGKRFGSQAKAKAQLGFEAKVALTAGLRRTIAWTVANLPLIERCMAKHRRHMGAYARDR
jgi:nucleoside-diphosphate-sugar epimerase